MSIKTNAKYSFGLVFSRFLPLNDDFTIPVPARLIGGVGPFDFSGVDSLAEVTLTTKIDAGAEESVLVDLSGAVSSSAVTVTELFTAINTATPTDLTASAEAVTGRLKIVYSGVGDPVYVQVYGECATIGLMGQGKGVKFVKSDTLKSIGDTPTLKESETFTTTDAKGFDTEIVSDGYRKGTVLAILDSAEDWYMLELLEGGTFDTTLETYETPTSDDSKIYFMIEAFYGRYTEGTNKEADLVNYVQKTYRSGVGSAGDRTHERGWADGNYGAIITTYKDENGTLFGDTVMENLTVEEYQTLDVYNV